MTDLDPREAFIFAVYPFIIVGAPIAAWLCGWTAWKLRRIPVALWWFLVAVSIISVAVWVDATWYMLYRLQTDGFFWISHWLDRSDRRTFPVHTTIRVFIAIPIWIFALTTIGVLKGHSQTFHWVSSMLKRATVVGLVSYILLVAIIYCLLSHIW
jgi:hypothetical protein